MRVGVSINTNALESVSPNARGNELIYLIHRTMSATVLERPVGLAGERSQQALLVHRMYPVHGTSTSCTAQRVIKFPPQVPHSS